LRIGTHWIFVFVVGAERCASRKLDVSAQLRPIGFGRICVGLRSRWEFVVVEVIRTFGFVGIRVGLCSHGKQFGYAVVRSVGVVGIDGRSGTHWVIDVGVGFRPIGKQFVFAKFRSCWFVYVSVWSDPDGLGVFDVSDRVRACGQFVGVA
jgi:hypothetical protein